MEKRERRGDGDSLGLGGGRLKWEFGGQVG